MLVIYDVDTGQIRQTSKNTPVGDVPEAMIPEGCAALKTDRTDFSPQTHRVSKDGRIIHKRAADIEAREIAEAWQDLRAQRAARLAASDWTQMPDSPADTEAWQAYRQALRDLPDNTDDPRNPEWPEKPE